MTTSRPVHIRNILTREYYTRVEFSAKVKSGVPVSSLITVNPVSLLVSLLTQSGIGQVSAVNCSCVCTVQFDLINELIK